MSHDRDTPNHPVTSRLVDAVRQMRIAAADRGDVVVELREATRTRLQLLAEDLREVIADIPADDERFDFALTSGLQPRFWIDATAHVMMAPDRRTYRFVRDTQLGRTVLAESDDRAVVVDRIVAYVAMRIHEREIALAGEVTSYRETAARPPAVAGRSEEPTRRDDGPLERISEALEALRQEAAQRGGGENRPAPAAPEPAKQKEEQTPAKPAPVAERAQAAAPAPVATSSPAPAATPKSALGQAQSIANAVVWVLLGMVIGAGALLLAFQNLLVQR
ncbi:MAG: hypothetical protein CL535_11140 [Ahrensia sp.]|nr:hypothetical protein [Ahrensia sp.]